MMLRFIHNITETILLAYCSEAKGLSFWTNFLALFFSSSSFSDLQDQICFNQLFSY